MRWAAASTICLLFVVGGRSAYAVSARHDATPPAGTFSNLQVCGATAFSRSQARCTKDERALPLVSNRISCSADLLVRRPGTLRRRFTYEGSVIAFPPVKIRKTGRWYFWINEDLKINLPLPGGRWGCAFTYASKTVRASFTSAGPIGPIVNTAVCRVENTAAYPLGDRVCLSDESGAPVQPTNAVYCYATFPNDVGHVARIAIVSGTQTLNDVSFTIAGALWFGWLYVSAPTGQTLPAGSYSCQYSLDGALVTEKPFELLG